MLFDALSGGGGGGGYKNGRHVSPSIPFHKEVNPTIPREHSKCCLMPCLGGGGGGI